MDCSGFDIVLEIARYNQGRDAQMTRPQYIALCIIGAVAVAAYLQSYNLAQSLQRGGILPKPQTLSA